MIYLLNESKKINMDNKTTKLSFNNVFLNFHNFVSFCGSTDIVSVAQYSCEKKKAKQIIKIANVYIYIYAKS